MEANEIARLRTTLGLSQRGMARELAVTQPAISKLESGLSRPSAQTVKLLEILQKKAERRKRRKG